ncbi:MAG: TolC family protein [Gallionella sp.]|jgi:outer membrane protein TolC
MNKRLLPVAVCLLFAGGVAAAAEMRTPFESAIQRALESHPDLGIERNRVLFEKARVDEARGAFMPSLNVFGTNQQTKAYDDFSGVGITAQYAGVAIPVTVLKNTPRYQANYGIELSYNLYSGGAHQARVTEMSAAEQAALAGQDVVRKAVILEVTRSYWGLSKAQIALRVAGRNLDYAQEQLNVARTQFEQGQIAKIDFDAKNIQLETLNIELRSAQRALQEQQRRYAAVLGVDAGKEAQPVEEKAVDIDQLPAHFGLMKQPEMQKVQADFMAAQQHIKQTDAEYLPVLDFYLRNTYVGRSGSDIGMAQSNMLRDATSIGVHFKWNLFDGYRSDSRTAQAVAASEQLRLQADKVQRDLYISQQESQAREEEAGDQLRLAGRQLEFAKSQLAVAQKRLENRQLSTLEFHAVQLAAANAESRVDSLKIDLLIQQIKSRL